MRMGKAIVQSHDHYVVLPKVPRSRKTKIVATLLSGTPGVLDKILNYNGEHCACQASRVSGVVPP